MGIERLGEVRALVTDVDGVMTNGAITVGEQGETKTFHVRDGFAIKLFQRTGHEIALLSGRPSTPVEKRAKELGIEVVKVGRIDKQRAFDEIVVELGIPADRIAYIGDDLPDLAPLQMAAVSFCPLDAASEVRAVVDHIVPLEGGRGVVRYVVETILKAKGLWQSCVSHFEVQGG